MTNHATHARTAPWLDTFARSRRFVPEMSELAELVAQGLEGPGFVYNATGALGLAVGIAERGSFYAVIHGAPCSSYDLRDVESALLADALQRGLLAPTLAPPTPTTAASQEEP